MRSVFHCVASRKRGVTDTPTEPDGRKGGSASLASHTPSSPNPLRENQSLSSPPLEPRGLLLSVMRQKVGKERSQGVFAPLANPRFFRTTPRRKFGPSPTPLEAMQNPDWRAQRHRLGRRLYESQFPCWPTGCKSSAKTFVLGRAPRRPLYAVAARRGRRLYESRHVRKKVLRPKLGRNLPMAAAATPRGRPQYAALRDEIASSASGGRCRSALEPGLPVATCMVRARGEIISDKLTVYRRDFLLRRGARGLRELRSRAGPRARGGLAKLRFARA